MATPNAAETLERVSDFAADFATSTLEIRDGSTVLATHTVPSFTASNDGSDGLATAAAIADATIDNSGTADNAKLIKGTREYALTLGASGSGADIIVTTTNYIDGETSSVTSLVARASA